DVDDPMRRLLLAGAGAQKWPTRVHAAPRDDRAITSLDVPLSVQSWTVSSALAASAAPCGINDGTYQGRPRRFRARPRRLTVVAGAAVWRPANTGERSAVCGAGMSF